jgi:hypothetical protein
MEFIQFAGKMRPPEYELGSIVLKGSYGVARQRGRLTGCQRRHPRPR